MPKDYEIVYRAFIAEEVDGVGDKGSGNNTSSIVAVADVLGLLGDQHSHERILLQMETRSALFYQTALFTACCTTHCTSIRVGHVYVCVDVLEDCSLL